jgi:hypothetical protein
MEKNALPVSGSEKDLAPCTLKLFCIREDLRLEQSFWALGDFDPGGFDPRRF